MKLYHTSVCRYLDALQLVDKKDRRIQAELSE
jgi:hypothetical protein